VALLLELHLALCCIAQAKFEQQDQKNVCKTKSKHKYLAQTSEQSAAARLLISVAKVSIGDTFPVSVLVLAILFCHIISFNIGNTFVCKIY
jgi:hypothetical protein